MIPHIVHYCWFGRGEKSALICKCINSWKEKLPGYEFMEWTEDNFDVNATRFTRQAYAAKRYAYVSDYARLCALQTYGGVYLDTDEELLKDITPLLQDASLVAGFETEQSVMVGVLAAEQNHPLINEFKKYYEENAFQDETGRITAQPNPRIFTELLCARGLERSGRRQTLTQGISIWPVETFCAKNQDLQFCITPETYGVQYYEGSWMPRGDKLKWAVRNGVARTLGPGAYKRMTAIYETLTGKRK